MQVELNPMKNHIIHLQNTDAVPINPFACVVGRMVLLVDLNGLALGLLGLSLGLGNPCK